MPVPRSVPTNAIAVHASVTTVTQPARRHRRPTNASRSRIARIDSAARAEAIADGAHGVDRRRVVGQGELAPQIADVDVDDVRRGIVVVAPHRGEDLLAREHRAVVAY